MDPWLLYYFISSLDTLILYQWHLSHLINGPDLHGTCKYALRIITVMEPIYVLCICDSSAYGMAPHDFFLESSCYLQTVLPNI